MRVTIHDAAADVVQPHVTPSRTVDDLVEAAVWRVGHISPSHRCLVLGEAEINRLEQRLGCPLLGTVADLERAVDQLADIKLGNHSFQFTPAQLVEIQVRAEREQEDPARFVQRIIHAMIPMFFQTAPALAMAPQRQKK